MTLAGGLAGSPRMRAARVLRSTHRHPRTPARRYQRTPANIFCAVKYSSFASTAAKSTTAWKRLLVYIRFCQAMACPRGPARFGSLILRAWIELPNIDTGEGIHAASPASQRAFDDHGRYFLAATVSSFARKRVTEFRGRARHQSPRRMPLAAARERTANSSAVARTRRLQ